MRFALMEDAIAREVAERAGRDSMRFRRKPSPVKSSGGGGETSPWDTLTPFPERGGRYLRVITLADKVTILNAFPDRGFKP